MGAPQAYHIAIALKGKRHGSGWSCLCPAHEDRTPSLSIRDGDDGKLLVHCFAGCQPLDILVTLRERGLFRIDSTQTNIRTPHEARPIEKADQRRAYAQRLWNEAGPAHATPVAEYLRFRGYTDAIPPTIRYHPSLPHTQSGLKLHGMIAAVSVSPGREITAVHRTFLKDDGSGKSSVEPNRMMIGNVKGGAVRLAPSAHHMAVSEGIETGLSIQLATELPTWAALSAKGIENLILPPLPLGTKIVIAADHDKTGTGLRAAEAAARRWIAEGRSVRIALPSSSGMDFNDILREGK